MATDHEIRLGKLVVERKLCTNEQVLTTLRERNADADGPDLGARLVSKGLFSEYVLVNIQVHARLNF